MPALARQEVEWRRIAHYGRQRFNHRVPSERPLPAEHLKQKAAERPAVRAPVDRLAVRLLRGTGKHDIWIIDRQRGTNERITRDPVGASFPHWSPDGKTIVFASARAGPWDLYKRPADGTGADQNVFVAPSPLVKYPSDITRDGRFLLFQNAGTTWGLGITDNKPPVEVVHGQYGRVSPRPAMVGIHLRNRL